MRGAKADALYGATGTYKTTQIGIVADWLRTKFGKKTLLVSAENGGWQPIQSLVDDGTVIAWPIRHRALNPIESMDLASQGYWPANNAVEDPTARLVKLNEETTSKIGLWAFEGLTSFGDYCLDTLQKRGASLSQDPSYRYTEGGTTYSGGNMSYYSFVQSRIADYITNSHLLPSDYVLWTALEAKGEEDRIPIFGPAIAGKKAISKVGQWVCNLLHMEVVVTEAKQDEVTKQLEIATKVWMYLRPHADPVSKIVFPAKVRAPFQYATEVPSKMEPDLAKLYEYLNKLRERASAANQPKPAQTTQAAKGAQ